MSVSSKISVVLHLIFLACCTFRRTVEVERENHGNIGWFPYSAGNGVVSLIPARPFFCT